jgi:hypothetical protein
VVPVRVARGQLLATVRRRGVADRLGARLGPAATFATTEHFNLQTARALTVSEANGRASIYLAALSSNLIALAFIAQVSGLGGAFYAFALILLPVLAYVGVVTFRRLVQSSIEDIAYAHRIALLRSFYLRLAPELEPYILVVRETRSAAPFSKETLAPGAWQLTLTTAGMVAVVNSVVVAACAGLVLEVAGVHSLAIPVAVRAVIGAGAFTLHERHNRRALQPRSCRSGRDPRPTVATARRGVKRTHYATASTAKAAVRALSVRSTVGSPAPMKREQPYTGARSTKELSPHRFSRELSGDETTLVFRTDEERSETLRLSRARGGLHKFA